MRSTESAQDQGAIGESTQPAIMVVEHAGLNVAVGIATRMEEEVAAGGRRWAEPGKQKAHGDLASRVPTSREWGTRCHCLMRHLRSSEGILVSVKSGLPPPRDHGNGGGRDTTQFVAAHGVTSSRLGTCLANPLSTASGNGARDVRRVLNVRPVELQSNSWGPSPRP